MNRLSVNEFCYVFKNVNHSERFYIEGGEFTSPEIEIVVRPNPVLLYYETAFHYPKYIKRRNDTVAGKTRFMVPLGTDVEIFFIPVMLILLLLSAILSFWIYLFPMECFPILSRL